MGTANRTYCRLAVVATLGLTIASFGCSKQAETPSAETPTQASGAQKPASDSAPKADDAKLSQEATPSTEATPTTDATAEQNPALSSSADETPTDGTETTMSPSDPSLEREQAAAGPDPFQVPDGPPEEIFEFLQRLQSEEPASDDPASIRAFQKKIATALVTSGDRILAGKPTDEQAEQAVHIKIQGLSLLRGAGDLTVDQKLEAMPAELEKAGYGSLVRVVTLSRLLDRFRNLPMEDAKIESFVEDLTTFFETSSPPPEEGFLAMNILGQLEGVLNSEKLADAYARLSKAFADTESGARMAGVARRMQLEGNEMPLEGTTLAGEPLDWSNYEGKVVLVDFWATWCGPCLNEMVNIRANYKKYQDHGFEVIGISTDDSRETLKTFKQNNEVPWTIVVDQDRVDEGKESMSMRYGIVGIPTVILIGKDGKVVSTDAHGPNLGRLLEELLGPVEAPEAAPEQAETSDATKGE